MGRNVHFLTEATGYDVPLKRGNKKLKKEGYANWN